MDPKTALPAAEVDDKTIEPPAPNPRDKKVYRAEDAAFAAWPPPRLDGTQQAAQDYVDRITASAWWQRECKPSWRGDRWRTGARLDTSQPPRYVHVFVTGGAGAYARGSVRKHGRRGYAPWITLGSKPWEERGGYAASTDPWIILHELAHVMTFCDGREFGHGRLFAHYFMKLVRRWLGPEAAAALRQGYADQRVKYRLPVDYEGARTKRLKRYLQR